MSDKEEKRGSDPCEDVMFGKAKESETKKRNKMKNTEEIQTAFETRIFCLFTDITFTLPFSYTPIKNL